MHICIEIDALDILETNYTIYGIQIDEQLVIG